MSSITTDQGILHYEVFGRGKPVILLHGWLGSWGLWQDTMAYLGRYYRTYALDFWGFGESGKKLETYQVTDFASMVDQFMDKLGILHAPLVGHSMGGVIITQAAEDCPDKIRALVYVCAYLPGNGETLADWMQRNTESLVAPNLIFAADRSYSTIRNEAVKEVLCADCSDEDVARASALLGPQASAPARVPLKTTAENFGRLPKVYIETLRDKVISTSLQRRMYTAVSIQKVITMDTSHSPFFSAPEVLVAHLTSL